MNQYQPVSCDTHSQYELLIMHPVHCQWHYIDNNQEKTFNGIAVDLITRDQQEFLVIQSRDSTSMTIRLDKIRLYDKCK